MAQEAKLARKLSLLDSVLLLAGGIIGSGVFLTAQKIALNTRTPLWFLLVWGIGMVITLLACFAFAEMGAMFPNAGGQYVFLREAYGEFVAFLYGWMIFTVSNGGTIAALATGFSLYIGVVFPALAANQVMLTLGQLTVHGHAITLALTRGHLVAVSAIGLLTVTNIFGVRAGATLQNVATWVKFAAIAGFVLLGVILGRGSWSHYTTSLPATAESPSLLAGMGVALIAVFWALDGWVYITWVAGEVKNPERNLPRSLVIGVLLVGSIYLAINAVYVYALPMVELAATETVAQTAAIAIFSSAVGRWLSMMIAISCFGAMAACILSGARVYYAMAEDGVFFRALARVHPRWRTPVWSLLIQGMWSSVLVLVLDYADLFTYVMFMMVLSYVLTVAALFVLRRKMPDAPRPYRCAGYPWLPALYVAFGSIWAINALWVERKDALIGIGIVLVGAPFYWYWRRRKKSAALAGVAAD
ncbi:MAG TPA: amino acid permease [Candidatus Angelobacter sp.]|nr:amino acid permease [Candidatus Angelobacter sp.]